MGRLGGNDRGPCSVRGCDYAGNGSSRLCRCERWLCWCLVLLVLLVSFAFGGIKDARADFWSDLLDGACPPGEDYRGYHRVTGGRCASGCVNSRGESSWESVTHGGLRCIQCRVCSDGFYRACEGDDGYPVPSCVADALDDDEESDLERQDDLLAAFQGSGSGGVFGLFGSGGINPAAGLFGDSIGAVEADDHVPQTGSDADGYSCPDGTELVDEGDNAGLCRVVDQCLFYGGNGGTFPDCTCADSSYPDRLGGLAWQWDQYSLRCVPGQTAGGSVRAPNLIDRSGGDAYIFNAVCGRDYTANSRGGYSVEDFVTRSSPEFVVRRGGLDVLRYGSVASLTIQLGRADWSLSSAEEDDEEGWGNILCSWVRGPLKSIEGAVSGFSLARMETTCPVITIPVFSGSAAVDLHCYIVGRWLGLIQAAFIVGYSFLGVRWFLRYG